MWIILYRESSGSGALCQGHLPTHSYSHFMDKNFVGIMHHSKSRGISICMAGVCKYNKASGSSMGFIYKFSARKENLFSLFRCYISLSQWHATQRSCACKTPVGLAHICVIDQKLTYLVLNKSSQNYFHGWATDLFSSYTLNIPILSVKSRSFLGRKHKCLLKTAFIV